MAKVMALTAMKMVITVAAVMMALTIFSWCFKPSQPQKIISGLRETFIKRYVVERTNEAEIRLEEQRKRRVVGRNYGMKYS